MITYDQMKAVVENAIKSMGLENFKKTSFFSAGRERYEYAISAGPGTLLDYGISFKDFLEEFAEDNKGRATVVYEKASKDCVTGK